MEEKKKGTKNDLEFLETEPEVKEFVRRTQTNRMNQSRTLQKKRRKREADYRQWIWLALFCIVWLVAVICGITICDTPVITVILVAVLETALFLCLCRSPIWLHGLVVVLNIVLGIIFQRWLFMILASIIYIAGVVLMHFVLDRHWGRI